MPAGFLTGPLFVPEVWITVANIFLNQVDGKFFYIGLKGKKNGLKFPRLLNDDIYLMAKVELAESLSMSKKAREIFLHWFERKKKRPQISEIT